MRESKLTDVSIIIISWNALHFLEKCLPSVYEKNQGIDFELILIDNNSTDGSREYINQKFPEVRYIHNEQNRGVAPARNQGFAVAKGKYILILDVDTEFITDNALRDLVEYMETDDKIGLIGAQLISSDGEIQKSCLRFPSLWVKLFVRFERFGFIRNSEMIKNYYMMDLDREEVANVDYVIGAFQFIRKKMIDDIGVYDENIFYGPEDIDYCLRAKRSGYKVIYYPKVKLFHFYQRITKRLFTKITFRHFKGLAYFFWKHKYINSPGLK
jgi:N-acetylglucosaminyl-diphospho-decaprenol L-rhamnosyltransferase